MTIYITAWALNPTYLTLEFFRFCPSLLSYSPHEEREDEIFVEESPHLEAALPEQDADDEAEENDMAPLNGYE